jgi:glycosyltransferase involved in cell wall biosynthesis
MKYLIVCGSISPTFCGIGKYVNYTLNLLPQDSEITYLTNDIQTNFNPNDETTIRNYQTLKSNLYQFHLSQIRHFVSLAKKEKPEIVIIHHQTFQKNYFDAFFNLFLKLGNSQSKVINVVHEFRHFSKLGKIRLALIGLFSNRILFSDASQREAYNQFTRNMFEKKTFTTMIGNANQNEIKNFNNPDFLRNKQNILNIGYHGFVQPAKGLDLLLTALSKFNKPFKLHILGEFKSILTNEDDTSVVEYHTKCLNIIESSTTLKNSTIVYGNIEPSSNQFAKILESVDLLVFPFVDSLTMRRTSFLTSVMASNAIAVSTYNSSISDKALSVFSGIEPSEDSILDYLNRFEDLDLQFISDKQIEIKTSTLSKNSINQIILNDISFVS